MIECQDKVYAVEIKVKKADVDRLKKKAEELSETTNKQVVPVITGAKVDISVRDYASKQGVLLFL